MTPPLDLTKLKVFPLAQRRSLSRVEEVLIEPSSTPTPCDAATATVIADSAQKIKAALKRNATVMLIYGAHLIKNGGQLLINQMLDRGWLTHLATNGAGTIHDWEFAFQGFSTESVKDNVATGTFGTWDETGRYIHLALLAGGLRAEGYGQALGRFIQEDGTALPIIESLEELLRAEPSHPLAPPRADVLQAMRIHQIV